MFKQILKKAAHVAGYDIKRYKKPAEEPDINLRSEFVHVSFAGFALQKLLDSYIFETVLDIGCGSGEHTELFLNHGKTVTAADLDTSACSSSESQKLKLMTGDFNSLEFEESFDCVWASHVLEHQPNVHIFLEKIHSLLKEGGVLAVTVPPLKSEIVGGHLSLWNGGLLLYNLVIAGFDCSDAAVCRYGYNISVIINKKPIQYQDLVFGAGDIDKLSQFLPNGCTEGFDGDIQCLNWDS